MITVVGCRSLGEVRTTWDSVEQCVLWKACCQEELPLFVGTEISVNAWQEGTVNTGSLSRDMLGGAHIWWGHVRWRHKRLGHIRWRCKRWGHIRRGCKTWGLIRWRSIGYVFISCWLRIHQDFFRLSSCWSFPFALLAVWGLTWRGRVNKMAIFTFFSHFLSYFHRLLSFPDVFLSSAFCVGGWWWDASLICFKFLIYSNSVTDICTTDVKKAKIWQISCAHPACITSAWFISG